MLLTNDLIFTEIDTVDAFDPATGDFLFSLDEMTAATISNSEDTQDVTGKNGRLLSRKKRNKSVTISGTNGIVSNGLLALQTGGEFTDGTTDVMWIDYLTVNASHKATTKFKATGTTGAEIKELYIKTSNGALGTELVQDSTAASGKFAYDPSTKELTFHTDVAEGTEVVVYYVRKVASAYVLKNESDKYSGKATLYVNGLAEDKCSNVYRVQIYFPKADFNGTFSLDLGDNATVHNFEATAMAGACGAGADYYTYTVFGANVADAT